MPASSQIKAVLRSWLGYAALAAPVSRGPKAWRRRLGMARVRAAGRLRAAGDYERAERAVRPLLDDSSELSGPAWRSVALVREKRGDWRGALEAARLSTTAEPLDLESLILRRRLAALVGENDEARALVEQMATVRPDTNKQVRATLDALAEGDVGMVQRYRRSLGAWGVTIDPEQLEEIETELLLIQLYRTDTEAFAQELRRAQDERRNAAQIIVRAFIRCDGWDDLAAFAQGLSVPGVSAEDNRVGLPIKDIRRAALRAQSAGHLSAAVTLAGVALAIDPEDSFAQRIFENGTDQLAILATGWTPAVVRPAPHEPRPGAVLSVLQQSMPIRSGGYATRTHGQLTSLRARGWDVRAVTRLGFPYDRWSQSDTRVVPEVDLVDGIPYHRLLDADVRVYPQFPLAPYIDRFASGVVEHAAMQKASVIHASSFYLNGLAGAAAAGRLGLPFIYEVRGLLDLIMSSESPAFAGTERHRFLTRIELETCLSAKKVFVITDALRREMTSRGVPPDRMIVLPNGVHADHFAPRPRDPRLEQELDLVGKTVIGYTGGLTFYEGLDVLLHAAASLKRRRKDFRVLLVGDGPYGEMLRSLVARLSLDDVVIFTGRLPHTTVPRYLSLIDISPFPRLPLPICELISPMKPLESMAMGKAVVVSDVAALTEIVQDGESGLVFRKGDFEHLASTLERLLDSPELRVLLGEQAREWVARERDWSRIVGIIEATYRAVTDQEPGRAARG
jgi:glycosyltransferase involved in cell wall biosynthesis